MEHETEFASEETTTEVQKPARYHAVLKTGGVISDRTSNGLRKKIASLNPTEIQDIFKGKRLEVKTSVRVGF